jgi:hypothetical protein
MITIPVSIGELIDKLSILQVKKIKITNPEKLIHVDKEFELLYNFSSVFLNDEKISKLYHELVETNSKLWEIEDLLRINEFKKIFDSKFIELSRNVYQTNDKRFLLKNEINEITSSEIREVKEYIKYEKNSNFRWRWIYWWSFSKTIKGRRKSRKNL